MRFPRRWAQLLSVGVVLLGACAPPTQPSAPSGAPAAPAGGSSASAPAAAAPQSNQPKRLVIAAREAAPVLSNQLDSDADVVQELVSAGLIKNSPRGEALPLLAEAVPTIENNLWKVLPDGRMETTWTLREGATWQDGTPITTDDLVFTIQVGQDRALPEFGHAALRELEGVRAIDSRTLVGEWKSPYIQADLLFSWEVALPLPKHILSDAYLNRKESFAQHQYWSHEYLHAGPFKVREFVPGERLLLDAFPGYIEGRPKVDQVEVRFISDLNTLVANLLAGEVDFTIGPGISVEDAMQAETRWPGGKMGTYPYQSTATARPQFLDPQPTQLQDVRFRAALLHALDRAALNQTVTHGLSPTSEFIIPPGAPEYEEVSRSYVAHPSDPRRAQQLLQEMGLTRAGDTYRDAAGNEMAFELQAQRGDTALETSVHVLADTWNRLGMRVTSKLLAPEANNREARATRTGFEVGSFSAAMAQPRRLTWLISAEIPTQENRYRGNNMSRYSNPELDALIDRFFVTVPPRERIELFKQIARHVTENVVVMSLFHTVHAALISNRALNVTPRTGHAQTWESDKWDVRQ